MRNLLIAMFAAILIAMLCVTSWASMKIPLWEAGPYVSDPWSVATLFDAYFGFLTFFCWLAWRERSNFVRVVWFVAIMLLGNIAMSSYVLWQLLRMKPGEGIDTLFRRKERAAAA